MDFMVTDIVGLFLKLYRGLPVTTQAPIPVYEKARVAELKFRRLEFKTRF